MFSINVFRISIFKLNSWFWNIELKWVVFVLNRIPAPFHAVLKFSSYLCIIYYCGRLYISKMAVTIFPTTHILQQGNNRTLFWTQKADEGEWMTEHSKRNWFPALYVRAAVERRAILLVKTWGWRAKFKWESLTAPSWNCSSGPALPTCLYLCRNDRHQGLSQIQKLQQMAFSKATEYIFWRTAEIAWGEFCCLN